MHPIEKQMNSSLQIITESEQWLSHVVYLKSNPIYERHFKQAASTFIYLLQKMHA
jgi:hypothetical protein